MLIQFSDVSFVFSSTLDRIYSAYDSSFPWFHIYLDIANIEPFQWPPIYANNTLKTCIELTVSALILVALSMVAKRFWQARPRKYEAMVPSSPLNNKAIHEHILTRNRRRWYIAFAVVASLLALTLGLGLGFREGRRHVDDGQLLPVTDLGYSQYQGINLQNGVKHWLGIRYAAAPIGDLRFAAPHDPTPNSTIQKASKVCLTDAYP